MWTKIVCLQLRFLCLQPTWVLFVRHWCNEVQSEEGRGSNPGRLKVGVCFPSGASIEVYISEISFILLYSTVHAVWQSQFYSFFSFFVGIVWHFSELLKWYSTVNLKILLIIIVIYPYDASVTSFLRQKMLTFVNNWKWLLLKCICL